MKFNVLQQSMALGRTSYVVADGGRAIVLVSMLDTQGEWKGFATMHDLVVHESRRKNGLGSRLVRIAEDVARDMGADTLRLAVEPGTWMEAWYFRLGFNETGFTIVGGLTFTVMEKNIRRSDASEPQATESAISNVD